MRLIDFFDRGAALHPARACFIDGARRYGYREVQRLSQHIAGALAARGYAIGAKAAVLSPNSALGFCCVLGILRAGLIWVPLNGRNAPAENRGILAMTECEVLFLHSAFADFAADTGGGQSKLREIVPFASDDGAGAPLAAWIGAVEPTACEAPHDFLAPVSIFPTGGTTGRPKGAVWTNLTWQTLFANYAASMPYDEPPVHLAAAPLTHAAGVVAFALMMSGATHVILPKPEPEAMLRAIRDHRVTTLYLPPTAIYMLLAHPDARRADFSSLKHFVYAAAPMSVDKLAEAWEVFGPVMAQTYGQAEAPMVCTFLSPRQHAEAIRARNTQRLASCGRPTPFTDVAIMDDAGRLCAPGEAGEIVVRGGLVMREYYNDPAQTEASRAFGWHHTGDIGVVDEEGFVSIVDRKKDMIITGGFNVYPSEIEQVIWSHAGVQDCAVVGVPDAKWGEAVKAIVEPKPGASVAPAEILALCKARLGSVKTPKSVEVWDQLPRSAVGKVLKREIRQRFWTDRARKI